MNIQCSKEGSLFGWSFNTIAVVIIMLTFLTLLEKIVGVLFMFVLFLAGVDVKTVGFKFGVLCDCNWSIHSLCKPKQS